ncbi:MAG: hypothetical protein GX823_04890 [Clostridiales bacterium]|nr:hypothetical protein [Clostridiales bacterium]
MKKTQVLKQETSRTAFAFLLVFALIFIRYCYFEFEYFYQLDDYIQYHNYTSRGMGIREIISHYGMLGARPLAGVLDIAVWSHFYPAMIFGLAVISAMYAASACIFRRVWSRHFGVGWIFIVIYALLPLGFEGTYWMSAATRIVGGLFFASLSLLGFEKWCAGGKIGYAALYAIAQLCAFAMYEQVLVFSFAATVLLAALNFKSPHRRALLALFAPAATIAYFIFTGIFAETSALFSERVSFALPTGLSYFTSTLPEVLSQLKSVFLSGGFYTLFRGFVRGAEIMLGNFNFLYVIAVLALCAVLFLTARKNEQANKKSFLAIVFGALLAAAPILPFFVIETPWFSMRGAVASFCGIALFCDALLRLLFGRLADYRTIAAAVASAAALVFCISSVSELHDYRQTAQNDTEFVNLLADALTRDGYVDKNLKIGLLNVEKSYLEKQNYFYHEHIHGVTESDWALTGALEARIGTERPSVVPIEANPMYVKWNKEAKRLSNFGVLYLHTEGELVEIATEPEAGGRYGIYSKNDKRAYFGYTYEDGDSAYFISVYREGERDAYHGN